MLTKVGGIRVGHATDLEGITGCTVVIFDQPAVCGVDVRGANAGTMNTDLLRPGSAIPGINAIVLAGGSSFGFAAVPGVMRHLEESGCGYHVGPHVFPVVCGAVIYDLNVGSYAIRPNAAMGHHACEQAVDAEFARGSVGVGTGATIGKLYGVKYACKGGVGTSVIELPSGPRVGALVVVNAFGDVIEPTSLRILAGTRGRDGTFIGTLDRLKRGSHARASQPLTNTTHAIVATDAPLTTEEACRVATLAHDGIARLVRPSHTREDGDTVFVASTAHGGRRFHLDLVGAVAAEAVADAILDAVRSARSLGGVPACAQE